MQMHRRSRSRRSRNAMQHGARKFHKWEDQEVQDLSRLVLKFVQRSGGMLPKRSDSTFWAFCCHHFQGRFTQQQLQDKTRNIKLRFLQLSSGLAKCVKVSEGDTFQVWTQIMTMDQGNDAGGAQHGNSSHTEANKTPSTQIPHDRAEHATGTNGMGGPSKGKAPKAGADKGSVSAAGGEACAREEEGQDTSTCSTENATKQSQYSHREDYGTNTKPADHDVHVTPDVGESARNVTLFQHIIAADLAATTKTLAEFVHYQRKVATV